MKYNLKYFVFVMTFSLFELNVKKDLEINTFCFINILQSIPTDLELGL